MRERRPGVWEVRVVVANDLLSGRSVQRSFTVHGDLERAEERRQELAEHFGVDRGALYCEGARWTIAELLERFIAAEHQWRPATRSSHASVARFLVADPLGRLGVALLAPLSAERAPARPAPRKHLLPAEIALLLRTAADQIGLAEVALAADPENRVRWEGLFVASAGRGEIVEASCMSATVVRPSTP